MNSGIFSYYYTDFGIILSYTPVIVSFVGAFALLANKRRTKPQIFLAVSFIVIGLGALFSMWYDRYGAEDRNEIIRHGSLISTVLVTLSALLYFIVLIQPSRLTKRYIAQLSGFVIGFISIIIIVDCVWDDSKKITNYREVIESIPSPHALFYLGISTILIIFEIYAVLTVLKMYKRHRKFVQESFSYQEDINLKWILYSIVLFALLGATDMSWILNSSLMNKFLSTLMMTIILCNIFWLGFRQDPVPLMEEYEKESDENKKNDAPYPQNVLSKETEKLKLELFTYFKTEKPYLNPNLSLTEVAHALNTNRTYLSQIINEELEMNFYSFVNQYRIDYAITLIKEQNYNQTIDCLCEAAGFKSRSVFYAQFKEITGLSPSEYIRKSTNTF